MIVQEVPRQNQSHLIFFYRMLMIVQENPQSLFLLEATEIVIYALSAAYDAVKS